MCEPPNASSNNTVRPLPVFGGRNVTTTTNRDDRRFLILEQTQDSDSMGWTHSIGVPMDGAFLCKRLDGTWLLVSGINPIYNTRYVFEDHSPKASANAHSVAMIGVPILPISAAQEQAGVGGARLDFVR